MVCYVWPCCMSKEAYVFLYFFHLKRKIILQVESRVPEMLFLNLQFCTMLMSSTSTDGFLFDMCRKHLQV